MIQALLLTAWVLSGVAIAARATPDPANRLGWAPMAVFFGPLWLAVVVEQRSSGRGPGRLRPLPVPVAGRDPSARRSARPARR